MAGQDSSGQFTAGQSMQAYRDNLITVSITWQGFEQAIVDQVNIGMGRRVRLVAQMLKEKTQANISKPVGRGRNNQVVRRSKPGQYPRAETTLLKKTIFFTMKTSTWARIGTPLGYGVVLELMRDRSFLKRTLKANRAQIKRMLTRTGMAGDPPVFKLTDFVG